MKPLYGITALGLVGAAHLVFGGFRELVWRSRAIGIVLVAWTGSVVLVSFFHEGPFSTLSNLQEPVTIFGVAGLLLALGKWFREPSVLLVPVFLGALIGAAIATVGSDSNLPALKQGVAPLLIFSSVAVGWRLGVSRRTVAYMLVAWSAVMLSVDVRNSALTALVAAGVILASVRPGEMSVSAGARIVLGGFLAALLTVAGYQYLASAGYLSSAAEQRFRNQVVGTANPLMQARPEFVVSAVAIRSAFFVGRGEAPLRGAEYAQVLTDFAKAGRSLTDKDVARMMGGGRVNAHSILFQTWVEGGLLTALGWLLLGAVVWQRIFGKKPRSEALYALGVVLFVVFCWDLLFSPWAQYRELVLGALVALALELPIKDSQLPEGFAPGLVDTRGLQ